MPQAIWDNAVIAESDDIEMVEGNAYFPIASVKMEHLHESTATVPTYCHWKGIAYYYDVSVDGDVNVGAAWTYRTPYTVSRVITDHIAFWNGVEVLGAPAETGLVEPLPSLRDGRIGWEALCWLIRHGDQDAYAEEEITANTDLAPAELPVAWAHNDVQRYATRYEWALEGGDGVPLRIVSTGPGPTKQS